MKVRWYLVGLLLAAVAALGMGVSPTAGAQAGKVFVTAMHSDLKGVFCSLSASTGANNTVWNFYVWAGTHPSTNLLTVDSTPWTQQGDRWVATVKLLSGVKWSDGTDVTPEDIAFTFNAFATKLPSGRTLSLELGGGWASPIWDKFVGITVDSPTQITVALTDKPGLVEEATLFGWDIFQKNFWEPKFKEALASADPVATLAAVECAGEPTSGPFISKRWEPGAFAEVSANSGYSFRGRVFRQHETGGTTEILPANLGGLTRTSGDTSGPVQLEYTEGPFVDAVVYNIFGSQSAAALAVVSGDADYHFNPLGYGRATLDQLESTPGVKVVKNAANGLFYLSFNMRKSPFSYVAFRQAVACVIDKEFVANQLLGGLVIPAYSPVPPGNTFWHRTPTKEDLDKVCVGLSEQDRLARARQLLQDAGFQFDARGRLIKDPAGADITELELLHPNAAYDNNRNIFGLHIVDRLSKLGVPVRDVPAGFNNIVTLVFDEQDFDMWQLGWGLGVFPGYLEAFFHSRNTEPGGDSPQGGVCSALDNAATGCQDQYDQLADQFLAEQDATKAQEIARELQRLAIFEWFAYVPTHYVQQHDAFRADRITWQGLENLPILDGLQSAAGFREFVQKSQ